MAETTLAVEDLLNRIKQLTGDLERVRQRYRNRIDPPEKSLSASAVCDVRSAQLIAELDAAVDDLQHAVWLYTETATARGSGNAPSPSKLLSRATDILCALSARPPLPKPEPDGASFVERLIRLMDGPSDAVTADPVLDPSQAIRKGAGSRV